MTQQIEKKPSVTTPETRTYKDDAAVAAFPLGGIGTGNVSLGARGNLRDWEIGHQSNKGNNLPNTFFALRTKVGDQAPITRVLEGPVQAPHDLSHGYHPSTSAGLPRLNKATLKGEYPIASIEFEDDEFPLDVELEAYTPLIPLNAEDSGIPCAILTYTITNPTNEKADLTLAGSMMNPTGEMNVNVFGFFEAHKTGRTRNQYREGDSYRGLYLDAVDIEDDNLYAGNVSLVTDHPNVTVKPYWLRGAWFDFLEEFWTDFTEDGRFTDLNYEDASPDGRPDTASLGLVDTLAAGESKTYRFILSWYMPNRINGWDRKTDRVTKANYATRFDDSWAVAAYVYDQFARLDKTTRQFRDALFGSTLPQMVVDALAANIVPVRSQTCFWLEDGRFYGWEGCFDEGGCCAGSCTHVWSYAQTSAFLFPSLERTMRDIEFLVETEDDGYMSFRNHHAFGEEFLWAWGDQKAEAAVDGQMGSILRAYREYQLSGDESWLSSIWDGIKRAIGFAGMHWDSDGDHVLDGRQHNTYDIEFYGPNPLSSIYYLAAVRAVEQMALVMGEPDLAERCKAAFQKGSQKLDELTWNGEFFIQKLDDVDAYKYQHGLGCLSDQLLGQLHARILGLGDLLPADHIRTAIKSIYDYNFRENFEDHVNCQRTYVLNDEAGLLLCSWPNGGRPKLPFVYSDEVWTGIEYQVAAHLIYEGWLDEGLEIVKAARNRHDGYRRNPWNEVECGHHYARSMASWAVLLALTGQQTRANVDQATFAPVMDASTDEQVFRAFWSNGREWGTFTQSKDSDEATIEVLGQAAVS